MLEVAETRTPVRPSVGAGVRHLRFDVGSRPFLVLFELTRACDLACRHCRAEASPFGEPDDLTTEEVFAVLDDLATLGAPRPIVVLTGGDPLTRSDLLAIVRHGAEAGLRMAVSPSGTPRATPERFNELRGAGASAVSLSLDGASAASHDDFRQVAGSFGWTVAACRAARAAGLHLQLNTTVTAESARELPELLALALELGADLWSLFFLVPTGRGSALRSLSPDATEDVLEFLYEAADHLPLKTTEAPQYRRVLLRRRAANGAAPAGLGPLYAELHGRLAALDLPRRAERGDEAARSSGDRRRPPLAVGDGAGVVFVSHRGDVQPSGFLPVVAGNVRDDPLSEIYASAAVLRALRDRDQLGGRCGSCAFREPCGGSRAQAFARLGDPLGEDPTCTYGAAQAGLIRA